MYPRTNYEMTEEDLEKILDACKPVPCMMIGDYAPSSPQENANKAWKALGKKMGFDYETVRPIDGKGQVCFSAVPSETKEQRNERLKRENEEKRLAEIKKLEEEIAERKNKLHQLRKDTELKPSDY